MPLDVIVGATTKDATGVSVVVGSALKEVRRVEGWNGTAWKLVAAFNLPLSATASPSAATGRSNDPDGGIVTTSVITITPDGGTPPFTYAWVRTGGDTCSIAAPTSAISAFSADVGPNDGLTSQLRCTVTDSTSQSVEVDVTATFNNFSIP